MRKMCYILNTEYNFLTPSQVIAKSIHDKGRVYKRAIRPMWDIHMVSRILKDEIYTGTLITHKTETMEIHKKPKKVSIDNQYRFENHHEAIISIEQFENVQRIMQLKNEATAFYQKKYREYLFGGFMCCADCGGSVTGVTRIRSKRKDYVPQPVYECVAYRKYGLSRCLSHNIKEQYLVENLKQLLINLKEQYKQYLSNMTIENEITKGKCKMEEVKIQIQKAKLELKVLLAQKIKDISNSNDMKDIVANSYVELEKEKLLIIKSFEKRLIELESQKIEDKKQKIKTAIEYFNNIIDSPSPSKRILYLLLDKIYIYHNKTVEFKLKIDIKNLVN